MRAILVRVGVDQAFGGWNAPVDPNTGEFVFVPIPDGPQKIYPNGLSRSYREMQKPVAEFGRKHGIDLELPAALTPLKMHLDPDFENLTYGDNGARRGSGIATLASGDMLAFYAGLRSIASSKGLIYAMVGFFVIEKVVPATDVPIDRHHENAHTRWTPVSPNDVVVKGKMGLSGRLSCCIKIGEWRDGAYRVRRDIEDAWGGLAVKDGFIQRSAVPPEFKDAAKFITWFEKQGAILIPRNN